MRRIFSRSLLDHLAGDNPRARAEFERLDSLLSDVNDKGQTVGDQLDGLLSDLGEGGKFQRATAILEAIANLPDRVGSIEIASDGQAVIRPIDGQDPASLMSARRCLHAPRRHRRQGHDRAAANPPGQGGRDLFRHDAGRQRQADLLERGNLGRFGGRRRLALANCSIAPLRP
jgi:hypothetical protein